MVIWLRRETEECVIEYGYKLDSFEFHSSDASEQKENHIFASREKIAVTSRINGKKKIYSGTISEIRKSFAVDLQNKFYGDKLGSS